MNSKSIFASKTLWLNLLGPVFTLLAAHGLSLTPDQQLATVGIVMSAANIVVRLFTSKPVHVVAPPAALLVPMLMVSVGLVLAACAGGSVKPIPLPDAKTLFAQACAGISTANGAFQAVSPALLVAGKLSQAQIDQEKATFAVASGRCDNPPVDATTGAIDYQALAIDTAGDAAAVYLLLAAR
jgi:hypothetical protein